MCLVHPAGSDKRQHFLQPTVAQCTASWTEKPTVGSHPVVGSKTTPREKTNNTVYARPVMSNTQTAPDFFFSTERKVTTGVALVNCTRGYLRQPSKISVSLRWESLSTCKPNLHSEGGTLSPEGLSLKECTHSQLSQCCVCKFCD